MIDFSFRYCVIGVYKDRDKGWRVYPVPFVRINVGVR